MKCLCFCHHGSVFLFFSKNALLFLSPIHTRTLRLYIDGPFGSPSEEVFNYDVSLCVAGGIGVTPFACVLHALLWVVCFQQNNRQQLLSLWLSLMFSLHFPAPCTVTAGRASGCEGCILCGSAGSSSPSTGSPSCCAPCTTRSGQRPPAAVFFSHLLRTCGNQN